MDSGCLLCKCELCGCLVVASTLRAREYYVPDRVGALEHFTQIVCADAAACYARSAEPDHWVRVGAAVPIGREPEEGAALVMCHLCHAPATVDELSIVRVRDEDGWWAMVRCADEAACEERERIGPGPPEVAW